MQNQPEQKKDISKDIGHENRDYKETSSTSGNLILLPLRRVDASSKEKSTFEIYVRKEGGLIRTTENSEMFRYFKDTFEPRELKFGDRMIYVTVVEHGTAFPNTFPSGEWTHFSPSLKESFLNPEE